MKYKNQILCGIISAIGMWCALILTDAFDEYIIDESLLLGGFTFILAPIALFIIYIRHIIRNKPRALPVIIWHIAYAVAFTPLQIYIGHAANSRHFFIEQKARSSVLDLNGIEYIFYGATAFVGFTILCILFHIIRAIAIHAKSKK